MSSLSSNFNSDSLSSADGELSYYTSTVFKEYGSLHEKYLSLKAQYCNKLALNFRIKCVAIFERKFNEMEKLLARKIKKVSFRKDLKDIRRDYLLEMNQLIEKYCLKFQDPGYLEISLVYDIKMGFEKAISISKRKIEEFIKKQTKIFEIHFLINRRNKEPRENKRNIERSQDSNNFVSEGIDSNYQGSVTVDGNESRNSDKKRYPVRFKREVKKVLNNWFYDNIDDPYISEEDKEVLSFKTGLTSLQVSNYFIRMRKKVISSTKDKLFANTIQKRLMEESFYHQLFEQS